MQVREGGICKSKTEAVAHVPQAYSYFDDDDPLLVQMKSEIIKTQININLFACACLATLSAYIYIGIRNKN